MKLRKLKNKFKKLKIFSVLIGIVLLISIYLNSFLLIKYNVLPLKFLIIYFIFVGIIPFTLVYFTVFKRIKKLVKNILLGIEVFYIIILLIVFFYLNSTFNFVENFTGNFDYETKNYYVLAKKQANYNDIKDLKNKNIGFAKNLDTSIEHALEKLDEKVKLNHKEYDGLSELIDSLENDEIESILIIDSFYDMLNESEEETKISDTTKIVYKFSIKEKIEDISKEVDVTKEAFNVYISAIDSYGNVTDNTRSDVNMVISVNPKTNKLLMINIPRDYFVKLAKYNEYDKLTHAGFYGVETSIKTIENLLDTEINYYARVNYSALIGLVDALGGVDVYSEYDFTSGYYLVHFNKGYNKVNGLEALEFVRTRKAFLQGDRVRGENQQRMIEAIIKKASNPSILLKYDNILKSLDGSFSTNISTENIMNLINFQLDKMPSWNTETISLDGSDSYQITYTDKSRELYVMIPNEETVENAKLALQNNK